MHHLAAITASLLSLGLVCAIYYCNILSRPGGWQRSELLAMILVSLLTGLFPVAVVSSLVGLWAVLADGLTVAAVLNAAVDLVSLGASVLTVVIFRVLVRETYRTADGSRARMPLETAPAAMPSGSLVMGESRTATLALNPIATSGHTMAPALSHAGDASDTGAPTRVLS